MIAFQVIRFTKNHKSTISNKIRDVGWWVKISSSTSHSLQSNPRCRRSNWTTLAVSSSCSKVLRKSHMRSTSRLLEAYSAQLLSKAWMLNWVANNPTSRSSRTSRFRCQLSSRRGSKVLQQDSSFSSLRGHISTATRMRMTCWNLARNISWRALACALISDSPSMTTMKRKKTTLWGTRHPLRQRTSSAYSSKSSQSSVVTSKFQMPSTLTTTKEIPALATEKMTNSKIRSSLVHQTWVFLAGSISLTTTSAATIVVLKSRVYSEAILCSTNLLVIKTCTRSIRSNTRPRILISRWVCKGSLLPLRHFGWTLGRTKRSLTTMNQRGIISNSSRHCSKTSTRLVRVKVTRVNEMQTSAISVQIPYSNYNYRSLML